MASEYLLKKAVAAFNALSPEQQAEMMEEQRQSWVRGNVGLSRDERGMTSPVMPRPTTVMASELKPTPETIDSVCLSYRHDFGLLDEASKRPIRSEALWWFEAWQKEGYFVTRPAPAATDTGLVTVAWRERSPTNNYFTYHEYPTPLVREKEELVTRSQAEELLAAKDADTDRVLADNRRCLVRIAELEADNAELTARIKKLEKFCNDLALGYASDKAELEAKLEAAEKALEPFANAADGRKSKNVTGSVCFSQHYLLAARAVLGGKPL